jgi:hypothetical protein
MALVKINIPGIGEVTAENAASEDTLIRLVAAIEKQTASLAKKSGGGAGAAGSKESKDLLDSKKKETKAVDDSSKAFKSANKGTEDYTKSQKKSSESLNSLKNAFEGMKPGLGQAGGALIDFGASVGKTAIGVAASFAKTYDEMNKNPIGAGAGLLNTGIDLAGAAAKTMSDVTFGAAKSIGSMVPIIGGGLAAAADGANAFAKAVIDAAVVIAKAANDIMAKEFTKSVDALKSYTAQGASFAGGMTEMRLTAKSAGLTVGALAASAKMASSDLRAMGLSQGEGVKKLAKGIDATVKTIGKSGGSLRDEMLGLGYSYEEQGAVMAQYMLQQKSAGVLEKMTSEQLARGTADYAKNLKVISDITGQDAKKLMEKARAESMRGALMGKLDAEQQKAFKDAHATLMQLGPEAGPQMQAALTQMLAGGTVTDPIIAQNAQAMEMIKKAAAGVKAGSQDMIQQTAKANGEFVLAQQRYGETATSTASIMSSSVSGLVKGVGGFNDNVRALNVDPKTGLLAAEAAEKQATATDSLTKSYQQITKDGNAAAMVMEDLATANLGLYAKLLSTTYQEATALFVKGTTAIKQLLDGTLLGDGGKAAVATTATKAKTASTAEDKAYKDATFLQKIGIGRTEEQSKASLDRNAAANEQYQTQISNVDAAVAASKQEAKERREQGKANGEFIAKLRSFFHGEGFAKGGIVTGPKSGYPAMLHGTEAVIPLEGGKKVPLDVASAPSLMDDFTKAMTLPLGEQVSGAFSKVASIMTPSGPSAGGSVDLSKAKSFDDELASSIGEQFNKLTGIFTKDKEETKQQKQPVTRSDNSEQLLKELKEIMATQLAKQDEMISKLGENVDINQRLLTNSYS